MNKQQSDSSADWDLEQFVVPAEEGKVRFHDFDLEPRLMRAIHDVGFRYCSPIQAKSLPHTLAGHDVLGKAQTGTGKTAAFLICAIQDLLRNPVAERYAGEARVLIIAPTRELVMQIAEDALRLTRFSPLTVHTLVGGLDYNKQLNKLNEEFVDILVATPGRLMDFCSSRDVYLDQVEILVIDEADRMLDMGFIPQVRRIERMAPRKNSRQTLMFSATFSHEVLRLADQWMHEPVSVEIEAEGVATETVQQHVYLVSTEEKFTLLFNLLQRPGVDTLMVFANRRDECRDLHSKLCAYGLKAGLLSGEVQQGKRVKTLESFKAGELQVLVATDVAGRGIHINDVSHVVNFTLPEEPEDYVHRIGRTGRAGQKGISISFACEDDAFLLPAIGKLLGHPIQCEQPPEDLMQPLPPPTHALKPDSRRNSNNRGGNGGGQGRGGRRPPQRRRP